MHLLIENLEIKKDFFEYDNVPCAVFSQPPISSVGLTEEEAVNQGNKL